MRRVSARARRRRAWGRGAALVALVAVLAVVNLVIVGSLRASSDDAMVASLRVETVRAFYAAESGALIAIRCVNAGIVPPAEGEQAAIGAALVRFEEMPPTGEAGTIVVEGRSGYGRRRLSLEVE